MHFPYLIPLKWPLRNRNIFCNNNFGNLSIWGRSIQIKILKILINGFFVTYSFIHSKIVIIYKHFYVCCGMFTFGRAVDSRDSLTLKVSRTLISDLPPCFPPRPRICFPQFHCFLKKSNIKSERALIMS